MLLLIWLCTLVHACALNPCGVTVLCHCRSACKQDRVQEANAAHVACVQADHQYTLRELSSVKATLRRRNNDLQDLESLVQDQESAACEL